MHTHLAPRTVRALTQKMSVLETPYHDVYRVVSQSGHEYRVNTTAGSCTCPDHAERDNRCKHQRRVAFATGAQPLPVEHIDLDRVDDQLGMHTSGRVRVNARPARTDGGDSEGEGADDGCAECAALPGDFPCASCYINGDAELPGEGADGA